MLWIQGDETFVSREELLIREVFESVESQSATAASFFFSARDRAHLEGSGPQRLPLRSSTATPGDCEASCALHGWPG